MSTTDSFFLWFYYGLSGLGGWFIFFLLALVAVIWLFYDSAVRRLPVLEWRLVIALTALLIFPAILFRFTVNQITDIAASPLGPFSEPIFYLGVMGGILPIVLAISYYISYKGLLGCPQGHVYEAVLGKCPHPDHLPPPSLPQPPASSYREPIDSENETPVPLLPLKQHVHAWLVTGDGMKDYQLFVNETKIGRSLKNDIVLEGDRTVSREAVRILEQNGHFRLYPLAPMRYPRINGHLVREPILLEPDDEIEFGENTILRFVKSR